MKQGLKDVLNRIGNQAKLTTLEADALMEQAFAMASTPEEKHEAGEYLRKVIGRRKRPDVDVKGIMGDAAEFLNLAYISKRYFNKDRTWLYQRLNQSMVNGKPAAFSEAELNILSESLKEISEILRDTSTQFTH